MENNTIQNTEIKNQETESVSEKKQCSAKKNFFQVLKFVLFSASAAVIEIASFTLFDEVFHFPYYLAYVLSLLLSIIWNFTFNRKFTFKSATNVPIAMIKVICFYLVFAPISIFGGNALVNAGWNEYLVKILTMLLNFVTEFLYQKFFVFKDNK